jgi:hypothetical protein
MTTAWVLLAGERHEGRRIIRIWRSRPSDAEVMDFAPKPYGGQWEKTGKNRWESGCDVLEIQAHRIRTPK